MTNIGRDWHQDEGRRAPRSSSLILFFILLFSDLCSSVVQCSCPFLSSIKSLATGWLGWLRAIYFLITLLSAPVRLMCILPVSVHTPTAWLHLQHTFLLTPSFLQNCKFIKNIFLCVKLIDYLEKKNTVLQSSKSTLIFPLIVS